MKPSPQTTRRATRALLPALAAAALLASQPATAQDRQAATATSTTPVVTIVRVAKPWYAPRSAVVGKMRDTVPQYAQLPGLAFKAFSIEKTSSDFGGVYFWKDAASAKAWFSETWYARVRKERGVAGQVVTFDAPVSIDNVPGGTPASDPSASVVTVVQIPVPEGVSRERLIGAFTSAVPEYRAVPGLLRKHFIISGAGTFGGVYLWKDEASATAWFNAQWQERVRKTYGSDARIEWYDTPILLPTRDAANQVSAPALSLAGS